MTLTLRHQGTTDFLNHFLGMQVPVQTTKGLTVNHDSE